MMTWLTSANDLHQVGFADLHPGLAGLQQHARHGSVETNRRP